MKIEIRQGKYPGEWRAQLMTDTWPDAARAVYEGTEQEAGAIFGAVLTWGRPAAYSAADFLAALNAAVTTIQDRLDADLPLIAELADTATYADVKAALGDILSLSAWFLASAFASCEQGNVSRAVRAFGRAAYCHGTFQALATRIQADLESPPTGPAHALAQREDQRLKPEFLAFCRAVKAAGAEVRRLDDLLNVKGYDPRITSIEPRTLKKWAREEGITFMAGRPKKYA